MATEIVKMVLKLDDKASGALGKVGTKAKTTSETFKGAALAAGKLTAGVAAIGTAALAAHKGLVEMGRAVANISNQFGDAAIITGLSAETLETFDLSSYTIWETPKPLDVVILT